MARGAAPCGDGRPAWRSRWYGAKTVRIRDTQAARDYLTTPSKDLATVCSLAGLDMQAVIEQMRKQIVAAPTPVELIGKPKPRKSAQGGGRFVHSAKSLTLGGETLTVKEWAERTGIKRGTIHFRLRKGWGVEASLLTPCRA